MALRYTLHSVILAKDGNGNTAQMLGPQIGGGSLAVSGAASSSAVATVDCFVHMKAGENCLVRIGAQNAATNSPADSFPLDTGDRDTKFLPAGQYLSVIAA